MKTYEVSNLTLKKEVLSYFFDRINYYEYRYIILRTLDDFKKNEKNIEYVIPQIKGEPYFLVFGTFNRKDVSFMIEKRKLKFNLDQCDVKDIKILQCHYKATSKTFIGSIFDGRVVNTGESNIFLIQDCYYLDGIKMNAWKLEKKIEYVDDYISRNMKESNLKIRKVDPISNIEELDKKISKSKVEINGYIFLQGRSGISYIFVDNENFNKNNQLTVEQESDNKLLELHENINLSYKDDELVFLLKKDAKPDVYHIYDKENKLIHFASIPDVKTSQLCYEALKNKDSAYFKCEMCPRWKRYRPVLCV
jgi:hypothetical protein